VSSSAGLDVVVKRKNPCPCRESKPRRPARNLGTILTELHFLGFKCFTDTVMENGFKVWSSELWRRLAM
jgi:hypothetical protein